MPLPQPLPQPLPLPGHDLCEEAGSRQSRRRRKCAVAAAAVVVVVVVVWFEVELDAANVASWKLCL